MLIHPSGNFAFVSLTTAGDIALYSIDATTGALSEEHRLHAGSIMRGMAMHSSGKYVYFTSQGDSAVLTFEFDEDNRRLAPYDTEVAVPNPVAVAVTPSGKFACVANVFDFVTIYPIDTNGELNPGNTVPVPGAQSITVDPSGKFVFVGIPGAGRVESFAISDSGELTNAGSIATADPTSLAVDPSGMFVCVTNGVNNTVSTYTIHQSSGALQPLGSPVATASSPSGLAIARLPS